MYYVVAICKFRDGSIEHGREVHVGNTSGDQECARLVKKLNPDALGATRYGRQLVECWAEYGTKIAKNSFRYCIFPTGEITLSSRKRSAKKNKVFYDKMTQV